MNVSVVIVIMDKVTVKVRSTVSCNRYVVEKIELL